MTPGRNLKFTAHRCAGGECPEEPVIEAECEDIERFWSDPGSWTTTGMVSIAGEEVRIESGWNMVYDLVFEEDEKPPVFNKIEINGCLSLKQGMDHQLKAKIIRVRGGEFTIGTKDRPYTNNAVITLVGEKESDALVIEDQGVEGGNKIIANLGKVLMYGK